MTQLKALRTALVAALALTFAGAPAVAQNPADTRPTVMIMYFENSAIGKLHEEYSALGKGIADLLITAMANNSKIRVVEREELQAILQEQNLVKTDVVDKSTAVKLGKLLSAHHLVTGSFVTDPKGNLRLVARSVDVETGVIEYTEGVRGRADDIMTLIDNLADKMNADLKLKSIQATRVGEAPPASTGPITGETRVGASTDKVEKGEKSNKQLDFKAAMLYSKALNNLDSGNKKQAEENFKAVLAKFPEFAPAQKGLSKLQSQSGN